MLSKKFPFKITPLETELNNKLKSYFTGEKGGFVKVGPNNYIHIVSYAAAAEEVYNFELRPDDIWIATFPRSGTTLTQEMVWLLVNDFDYEAAKKIKIDERSYFLELDGGRAIPLLKDSTKRRIIKTHLPLQHLPPNLLHCGAKIIYLARNPKDVAVSLFHQHQLLTFVGFVGDFKTYWNFFENSLIINTPYWNHIEEAWINRKNPNLLFLFFEDIINDIPGTVQLIAEFLGKMVTQDEIEKLADHLKFDNFKNNAAVNYEDLREIGLATKNGQGFIRKGKTGSWKDDFDKESNSRANFWIKSNLERIGIEFPENCQLDE